mmetsp:Transcript_3479/g.8637  ORF Transcript_3479/g.8637 Transcript_3479/m.8637 type:complete len:1022 (+) Transcript_3479:68-3133(+)
MAEIVPLLVHGARQQAEPPGGTGVSMAKLVQRRMMLCIFSGLSMMDMVTDGTVFADLVIHKKWPVLGGCLAAVVLLPQLITFCFLASSGMREVREIWQVTLFPLVGFAAFFMLDVSPDMQQVALFSTCLSPIPLLNVAAGWTEGKAPAASGALWWEIAEGMIEAPCSAVLTLYASYLTRTVPSHKFLASIVSSCASTAKAADKLNRVGEHGGPMDDVLGPLQQLPDVVLRIIFLATFAFLTRPYGDGSQAELQSSRSYLASAVVAAELVMNSMYLRASTAMPFSAQALLSTSMLIGHPPGFLTTLSRCRNPHRMIRLMITGLLALSAAYIQVYMRLYNPEDRRLETLWDDYKTFVILLPVSAAAVLLHTILALLTEGPPKRFAEAQEEVAAKFHSATQDNDVILTDILCQVDGAEVPAPDGVPIGLVQAYTVSELQGRTQLKLLGGTVANEWRKKLREKTGFPLVDQAEEWDAFKNWQDQVARDAAPSERDDASTGPGQWGGKVDRKLEAGTALELQFLALQGRVATLQVDMAKTSDELVFYLQGTCEALHFLGWRGVNFDLASWIQRWRPHKLRWEGAGIDMVRVVEEVLPSCSCLKTVELQGAPGSNFGDDGAQLLSGALRHCPWVSHVDVQGNSISQLGTKHLSDAMHLLSMVEFVSIRDNKVGREGMAHFAEMLKTQSSVKHIDVSQNDIGDDGVLLMCDALRNNAVVQHINVRGNHIGPEGAQRLAGVIRRSPRLEHVNISGNPVGPDGMNCLAAAIGGSSSLLEILASGCDIGVEGMQSVSEAVKASSSLQSISVAWHVVGDQGCGYFAEGIQQNSSIQRFGLAGCGIGPAGMKRLADAIGVSNVVKEMDFRRNELGDEGVRWLAELVEAVPSIKSVNLRGNRIGPEGVRHLAKAIKVSATLSQVDMSDNELEDLGMEHLSEAIKSSSGIRDINVSNNGIGPNGARHLAEAIEAGKSIQVVNISENGIRDAGAVRLCQAIKTGGSIRRLILHGTGVGFESIRDLQAASPSCEVVS